MAFTEKDEWGREVGRNAFKQDDDYYRTWVYANEQKEWGTTGFYEQFVTPGLKDVSEASVKAAAEAELEKLGKMLDSIDPDSVSAEKLFWGMAVGSAEGALNALLDVQRL